ncbi:5822_t:CDS:2 [Paraglomus brasilianum]|uniref:5822_t:CDS:1 n=1 Tax=Paraglomus brasilianum TaxID=144538 RepID=A0A9N9AKQ0_9GLOM|nr:5822_t:CDS:2 [Paraglomus brasilianum]
MISNILFVISYNASLGTQSSQHLNLEDFYKEFEYSYTVRKQAEEKLQSCSTDAFEVLHQAIIKQSA